MSLEKRQQVIALQKKRKRIEECFGWLKTIALMRKVRHRGLQKVGWVFTFAAAAYNLVRMKSRRYHHIIPDLYFSSYAK